MSRALHVDDSLSQFIQSHLQVWKIQLGNTNSHTWNATNLYQKEYFKIQITTHNNNKNSHSGEWSIEYKLISSYKQKKYNINKYLNFF